MHPVLSMKDWAHMHHLSTWHEMSEQFSQWTHKETFWPVVGIILVLGFVFAMMALTFMAGEGLGGHVTYSYPYFYGPR